MQKNKTMKHHTRTPTQRVSTRSTATTPTPTERVSTRSTATMTTPTETMESMVMTMATLNRLS